MSDDRTVGGPQDFQDPLDDYEPKTYDDPIQQALAADVVRSIRHHPFVTVSPDTQVSDAVRKLADLHVGCLLVESDGRLVGLFSDRDVLDRVALEYDTVKDRPVSEVMTTNPVYVYETDPSAAALCVMAASGYRHVPILDLDDKIAGIVSPQRVLEFLQKFFDSA